MLEAALEGSGGLVGPLVDALPARHRARGARADLRATGCAGAAGDGSARDRLRRSARSGSRRYDDGVRARMRQMFDVDWTDSLLYDLVINTETIGVTTAVEQVLALVACAGVPADAGVETAPGRPGPGGASPGDPEGDSGDLAGGRGRPGDGAARAPGGPRRIRGGARGRAHRRAGGARRDGRCRATSRSSGGRSVELGRAGRPPSSGSAGSRSSSST